jgi:hypothetical protein
MMGMNSHKGFCAARDGLLDELADLIITAAAAWPESPRDAKTAGT